MVTCPTEIPQEEKWQELGSPDPASAGEASLGLPALPAMSWGEELAQEDRIEAILGLQVAAGQYVIVLTKSLYYINFFSGRE